MPSGRHAAHDGAAAAGIRHHVREDAAVIVRAVGQDVGRLRRGREWPATIQPTYRGYSIGNWIENGAGRYDVLEVDTHGPFKGPRAYDGSGLPLAFDNESTFKERFHLEKDNPNILHDEITVFDHALTRPWSVDKTFRRNPNPRPNWPESPCAEANATIVIGKENYFLSAEGMLMPTKRDQPPPDLRYFKRGQN
jgi:hypothetical protein